MTIDIPVRPVRCLAFAALCGWGVPTHAQTEYIRFDHTADDTTQYVNAPVALARWDNGDVVRVLQINDASNDHTLRVYRTAADGSLLWAKRIETAGTAIGSLHDVAALPDGSLMICGQGALPPGFLLRMDASGALVMARSIDVGGNNWPDMVQVVNDSTVRIAGYRNALPAQVSWMATCGIDGVPLDAFTLMEGALGTNHPSMSIHALSNGSLLHIARRQDDFAPGGSWVSVCMIDSAGSVQWCNGIRIGANTETLTPLGSVMLADGTFRIVCHWTPMFGVDELPVVIALSPTGSPMWAQRIELPVPTQSFIARGAVGLSDTTFAIIGIRTPIYRSGMLILGASGTILGAHGWDELMGGLHEAVAEPGGEVIATGYGVGAGFYGASCTLLRCAADDPLCGDLPIITSVTSVSLSILDTAAQMPLAPVTTDILPSLMVTDQPLITVDPCLSTGLATGGSHLEVEVWPTPANDVLHVRGRSIMHLDLIDLEGRRVGSWSPGGSAQVDLDIGRLQPGLYQLWIDDAGIRCSRRVMKE